MNATPNSDPSPKKINYSEKNSNDDSELVNEEQTEQNQEIMEEEDLSELFYPNSEQNKKVENIFFKDYFKYDIINDINLLDLFEIPIQEINKKIENKFCPGYFEFAEAETKKLAQKKILISA